MNNKNTQFSVNDLFSVATIALYDVEGKEVNRVPFWIVLVFGLFSGLLPLAVVFVAIKQWKVALVSKEDTLK